MADGRKNNGGPRKNAGRKPKRDEQKLVETLSPFEPEVLKSLGKAIKDGKPWAIKLWFEYVHGKPTQRVEQSGPDGGPIKYEDVAHGLKKLYTGE